MKSLKKMSNSEFVHQLMNYSPYGALVQLYIISCISAYTEDTIARNGANNPMKGFCSDEVWLGLAKDVQRQTDLKYGREEEENPAPSSKLTDKPIERKENGSTTTTTSGGTEAGINE